MKKAGVIALAVAGTALFFSCGKSQYTNVDMSPKKIKVIRDFGEDASQMLLSELKSELKKALKTKGPVDAIEVCSKKALTITQEVAEEIGDIQIKRTSFKYRNPNNKPDQYEAQALKFFEETLKKTGKLPPYYIQKVDGEYRYYKPLKIQPVCLTCHGDPKHMDEKVVQKLKELYPQDKATGYKIGDFRGVIRVSIPEEVIKKSCL
ncbi:Tll0287-like domain-containing protein [Persephonella sp.]